MSSLSPCLAMRTPNNNNNNNAIFYTISGLIFNAAALSSEGTGFNSIPGSQDLYCARGALGYCPVKSGGNCKSIRFTVSDAIVSNWL